MKIYRVNLSTIAYIAAENLRDAYSVAAADAGRIMGDDPNPTIELDEEITNASHFELSNDGWDTNCLPYGSDDTIEQILMSR